MSTMDGKGRTALVTGASAGIGEQFAEVFARHGFDLVLTARREDRLDSLAERLETEFRIRARTVSLDLAAPTAPDDLFEATEGAGIAIDALVNNAGYAVPGAFRSSSWKTHADFLQVLVTAVVHLCHLYESKMIERGYGRIINVSSLAGLVPGSAGHTLYSASKSFLIKFSESLALEHAADDINVTAVCPGFTYSEFHDVLGNRDQVSEMPQFMWMDAETVACQGYDAVMKGKAVYVNGSVNSAIATVARLLPRDAAMALMKRQSAKIRKQD